MNFGSASRDSEDEQQQHMVMMRGKLPFSSYSSSPSSSTSVPSLAATTSPSWYHDGGGPDTRLELMDSSPRNTTEEDNNTRGGGESDSAPIEREHMFDKVVTPSDVGKLNRLVIPKQHAEKYFPLDSTANEKGLLLNFEDRNGKPWRFRYSYWNSSQSYVMTKGWSRFVKEKKLDAGDIVSFQRGLGDLGKDRLYIDWRRRPDAPDPATHHHPFHHHHPNFPIHPPPHHHHFSFHPPGRSINPWSPLLMRPPGLPGRDHLHLSQHQQQQMNYSLNIHHPYRNSGGGGGGVGGGSFGYGNVVNPVYYLRSAASSGGASPQFQHEHQQQQQVHAAAVEPMVLESVPVVQGKAAAKRLRLFGVNMECPISESDEECDILSSTTIAAQPALQLRLYDGTPLQHQQQQPMSRSSSSTLITTDFLNRSKASAPSSSMSLDFDM